MTTPRDSLPGPLRAQIEAAALSFAAQIVGAFEKSIDDVTTRLTAQASTAPARAPRKAKKTAPAVAAPKHESATERRIETLIGNSDTGLRVEQIKRALGSTPPDLLLTLQSLMAQGRIAKRGKARGTTYYVL